MSSLKISIIEIVNIYSGNWLGKNILLSDSNYETLRNNPVSGLPRQSSERFFESFQVHQFWINSCGVG